MIIQIVKCKSVGHPPFFLFCKADWISLLQFHVAQSNIENVAESSEWREKGKKRKERKAKRVAKMKEKKGQK